MHAVTAVSSARRAVHVPGVRRYRVWWLDGRAWVVPAVRKARAPMAAMSLALGGVAGLVGAVPVPSMAWALLALLASGAVTLRAHWPRYRTGWLRRRGARPGPWVWAIDAESAACTARIRADAIALGAQARRMPSMRIQSPSCSQRR